LQYVEKKIDLFNGESLEPWYLKINPQASAPSLVVGNEKITQSVEIIRWADRQGEPLGGDSVDRAFVNEWLNKVDAWDGNLFAAANTPAGAALKVSPACPLSKFLKFLTILEARNNVLFSFLIFH